MSLSSKSNVNPKIWGPYAWETIHFIAYGYPEKPTDMDKKAYFNFYFYMMKVLPCDKCTNSAQELFKKLDINKYLDSKDNLIKWTYLFHKMVNDKLGKNSPSLDEFMYNFTNKSKNIIKININDIIVFTILLILLVLLFMRYTLGIL